MLLTNSGFFTELLKYSSLFISPRLNATHTDWASRSGLKTVRLFLKVANAEATFWKVPAGATLTGSKVQKTFPKRLSLNRTCSLSLDKPLDLCYTEVVWQ